MIINTKDGKSLDTDSDLTAPERHILQKLFLWRSMARSLDEFREKTTRALDSGWNNSGPVVKSPSLKSIIRDLEEEVIHRLEEKTL